MERALIRVGGSSVTVREFHESFESSISSPSVLYSDPEALLTERYRTLNRLTEELIILERARELSLSISDEELSLAVDDFKKDFPDDTFEQTLIENGISYLEWEKGLKRRLLMEKVIREDLSEVSFPVPLPAEATGATAMDASFEAQLATGPETDLGEDIASDTLADDAAPEDETETFAEGEGEPEDDSAADPSDDQWNAVAENPPPHPENEAESPYDAWLARLKAQYTIEIDWKLWEEIEQEDTGGI